MTLSLALWLLLIGFLGAAAALVLLLWLQARTEVFVPGLIAQDTPGIVFLFDGEELVDATASARALLAATGDQGSAWDRLLAYTAPRFCDLAGVVASLPEKGRVVLAQSGRAGPTLVAEWQSGLCRIALVDPMIEGQPRMMDALSQSAQEQELAELRALSDAMPALAWRETEGGEIVWANRAYAELAMRLSGQKDILPWPMPRLFPVAASGRTAVERGESQAPLWFDCRQEPDATGHRLCYALPADDTVRAETALRSFVQTLTKTFAELPIGLAIFDQKRRLQLFNPALTDLTALPVDFLSARPALTGFLDAMRSAGTIPEPEDYKSWRARMAAVEQSAAQGSYEETWTLPSGKTYRVSGRPHPEGALALLIEDISSETTRTRRYRADLELGQSVIDSTDEAIAVLSASGTLVMSNDAYAGLWGHDPSRDIVTQPITALTRVWQDQTAPTHFWTMAQTFVLGSGPREPWVSQVVMSDGRILSCRMAPLAGGASLIGFRVIDEAGAAGAGAEPLHETAGTGPAEMPRLLARSAG